MIKLLEKMKEDDGFTLVEMAIVILIIAALLLIIIPNIGKVTENVGDTADDAIVKTVETQMVLYEIDTGNSGSASDLLAAGYITDEQHDAYVGND